jgi:serine/threonine protein kinase
MIQFYNFASWAGVAQRERPRDTPELGDFGLMDMEYGLFTLGHDVGILNSDAVKMDGFEGSSRQQGHLLYDYLRGLWWMQRRGLKHCDIKPANLVVVKNPTTGNVYGKLIDMGVTVPKEESCFAFTRFYAYQTPTEGYKPNAALNLANYDVYALGLSMLYAMGIEAESPEDAGFSFEVPAANPEKQSPALYYRGDKLRQRLMEKENFWFANLRCEDPVTKQPRFDMARDLMMRFFPEDVFARESERESLLQELLDHECFDDIRVQEIDGQVLKRRGDLISPEDAEKPLIETVWTPKQNDPHRRAKFEAWLKREIPVIAPATHVTPIGGNAKINAFGGKNAFMGNNGQAPEANILGRAARVVLPNAAADTFDDIRARYADGGHNDISGEKLGWFLFVGLLLMVLVGLSLERYSRSNLRKII